MRRVAGSRARPLRRQPARTTHRPNDSTQSRIENVMWCCFVWFLFSKRRSIRWSSTSGLEQHRSVTSVVLIVFFKSNDDVVGYRANCRRERSTDFHVVDFNFVVVNVVTVCDGKRASIGHLPNCVCSNWPYFDCSSRTNRSHECCSALRRFNHKVSLVVISKTKAIIFWSFVEWKSSRMQMALRRDLLRRCCWIAFWYFALVARAISFRLCLVFVHFFFNPLGELNDNNNDVRQPNFQLRKIDNQHARLKTQKFVHSLSPCALDAARIMKRQTAIFTIAFEN